jgi:hypothetical protein
MEIALSLIPMQDYSASRPDGPGIGKSQRMSRSENHRGISTSSSYDEAVMIYSADGKRVTQSISPGLLTDIYV